jgi:hypothetical protein
VNFANPNSYGTFDSNPDQPRVCSILLNGTSAGTATALPSGIFTFQTAGFTMNPGDRLVVRWPNELDATAANPALTLVAIRLT